MTLAAKPQAKTSAPFTYPLPIAKQFVRLFEQVKPPTNEQLALLAAAYYTLSVQKNVSSNRSNMHLNSAIAVLKSIPTSSRRFNWGSQIAHAYFRRAELLEDKEAFLLALQDYQQVINELEVTEIRPLGDKEHLMLAQSAISIADLIVSEQIEFSTDKPDFFHPLYYINTALEHLKAITETDDEIWATHAYAHRIAGIALSEQHFIEAKEAFRVALLMAFKANSTRTSPLLADIYTCLGLLYEQQYQACAIKIEAPDFLDPVKIYLELSLLFSPAEENDDPEYIFGIEQLFELVYRVLDPCLSRLSLQVITDFIDASIYAFMCILDGELPNQILSFDMEQAETLDAYAQHIHWLLVEAFKRSSLENQLVDLQPLTANDTCLDQSDVLNFIEKHTLNNVYYLKDLSLVP